MIITPFYGEVLIILMLAVCCLRSYFITNTRLDSFSLFAPAALILTVLQIFNWGYNLSEVMLLFVSLLVFFINYRSLIRFCNHLYVDSYSAGFIISSSIALVFLVVFSILFIIYLPHPLSPEKFNVERKSVYYGKQSNGEYAESTDFRQDKSLRLTTYYPSENNKNSLKDTIILFTPDKRSCRLAYEPYMVLLAKAGYKIYIADFGCSTIETKSKIRIEPFIRRNLIADSRKTKSLDEFLAKHPEYTDICAREYEILTRIADKNEPIFKKFVILGDGVTGQCFSKIKNPARNIYRTFDLSSISEYKTSGYGFIQHMDPLYAKFRYDLNPDETYFIPSYAVMKTRAAIEALDDIN